MFALEGEIQNNRDNPGALKPAEIRAKRNRIYEIQNELRIDDFLSIQKWTGMSDSQKKQLIDLGGQLTQAEADLFELAQNPDYGVEGFNEAYKAAEEKVMQLQKQQGELLKTQKYKSFEYLRDEVKVFPPSVVEARSQLYQASRDLASIQNDGKVVSLADSEAVDAFIEDNNLSEEQAEGLRNSNAAVIGGRIIQNESAIRDQILFGSSDIAMTAAISPLHELFHLEAKKQKIFTGKNLSEKLKIAVLGLEDIVDQKVELGSITEATANSIKNRIKQYKDDPILTENIKLEEVMAVFTESVLLGKIKKSDMPNMYGTKSFLNTAFSTLTGGKFKSVVDPFTTSNDLYEFISNFATKASQVELQVGDVEEDDSTIKPSKIYQEVETFKDDLVNEQTKNATAFLIADKLQNEVDRRLKIDVDQETREDITRNFLFDDRRGLLGLLQGYDPARNESIMGYLNSSTPGGKLLDARLIEFYENDPRYNQIVQSTTDESVQRRAEQVTAEEVVTETAVKPQAKAIDPFRIMPNVKEAAITEVQESIAGKDVDVTEVTYKELKDIAPYQAVADFFNVPVSRIKNPKDNLRKSDDVANIQRWILKNEPTLKNLFTEANRDVVEVTEGNKVIRQGGEPTAIPRNLLNKFYTKGNRVGNNFQWKLKPYDRTTFLEAVGIKDGKVDPNFTPRAAEAQTIKGILDMYTRNLGNVAARDIIEGREDIALAEKARAKAEVAKGKPRLMFSRQGLLDVTQARDINKVLKIVGMDSASVPDSKRADIQKAFEDAIKKIQIHY